MIKIFLSFLISCADNSHTYSKLENCINQNLINKFNSIKKINKVEDNTLSLFDSIGNFEKKLIKVDLLSGKTKEDYLALVKKLNDIENTDNSYQELISNSQFLDYISNDITTMNFLYDKCPNDVGLTSNVRNLYFKVFEKGYPDTDILNKLIELDEFNNDIFRKSICYLVFINIKYREINNKQQSPPKF